MYGFIVADSDGDLALAILEDENKFVTAKYVASGATLVLYDKQGNEHLIESEIDPSLAPLFTLCQTLYVGHLNAESVLTEEYEIQLQTL